MPPIHKPLKNDGPICRVCGCSQHNACLIEHGPMESRTTCSWAETRGADKGPLCTACAGTVDDALEVIGRVNRLLKQKNPMHARSVGAAFIGRCEKRKKEVDAAG